MAVGDVDIKRVESLAIAVAMKERRLKNKIRKPKRCNDRPRGKAVILSGTSLTSVA
jgi:hypothetical protein